jgi:hypothetical protein
MYRELSAMNWDWGRPFRSDPIWGKAITPGWCVLGLGMIVTGSAGAMAWGGALGVGFLVMASVAIGMAAGVIPRR